MDYQKYKKNKNYKSKRRKYNYRPRDNFKEICSQVGFASNQELMEELGLSKQEVVHCIANLTKKGWIDRYEISDQYCNVIPPQNADSVIFGMKTLTYLCRRGKRPLSFFVRRYQTSSSEIINTLQNFPVSNLFVLSPPAIQDLKKGIDQVICPTPYLQSFLQEKYEAFTFYCDMPNIVDVEVDHGSQKIILVHLIPAFVQYVRKLQDILLQEGKKD